MSLLCQIYCWAYFYLSSFMIINLTNGSLGMVLYRLLYVKAPHYVKYNIGETKLLVLIASGGLTASVFLTILYGSGNAKTRAALNMCFDHSDHTQVNLYHRSNFIGSQMEII